jgi:hypothetical protein
MRSYVRRRLFPLQPHVRIVRTGLVVLAIAVAFGSVSAATLCVRPGGGHGCYSTISAAVAAASAGDVIRVNPGTYHEQVIITKSLSLLASERGNTIIDATGLPTGIFINGMAAAPNPGVWGVVVSGFRVRNANFEGILIANASDVTILENEVTRNNRALDIQNGECPNVPPFETNEGLDCGEGIHLMGVDHSSIIRNEVANNSGGILTSDETGASHDNLIAENFVHDNPFDCGITLASHAPAVTVWFRLRRDPSVSCATPSPTTVPGTMDFSFREPARVSASLRPSREQLMPPMLSSGTTSAAMGSLA